MRGRVREAQASSGPPDLFEEGQPCKPALLSRKATFPGGRAYLGGVAVLFRPGPLVGKGREGMGRTRTGSQPVLVFGPGHQGSVGDRARCPER
jgi:hypothetical protein